MLVAMHASAPAQCHCASPKESLAPFLQLQPSQHVHKRCARQVCYCGACRFHGCLPSPCAAAGRAVGGRLAAVVNQGSLLRSGSTA